MQIVNKIKKWFQNYWYYYKWIVIIGAFFIGVIVFCLLQSENKKDYDVCILYTGPYMFSVGEKSDFESSFVQIMSEDYDKNGDKNIQVIDLTALTDEQLKEIIETSENPTAAVKYAPYAVDNVKKSFSQQAFAGDSVICILDEYWYNILLKAEGLEKLENVLGYKPENMKDEYSVYFSSLKFSEYFGWSSKFSEDTLICFRKMSTAQAFYGKSNVEKNYSRSIQMLKDIFSFG